MGLPFYLVSGCSQPFHNDPHFPRRSQLLIWLRHLCSFNPNQIPGLELTVLWLKRSFVPLKLFLLRVLLVRYGDLASGRLGAANVEQNLGLSVVRYSFIC